MNKKIFSTLEEDIRFQPVCVMDSDNKVHHIVIKHSIIIREPNGGNIIKLDKEYSSFIENILGKGLMESIMVPGYNETTWNIIHDNRKTLKVELSDIIKEDVYHDLPMASGECGEAIVRYTQELTLRFQEKE